ncbi:dihydrodipicolinate synthase family protein [Pseudescherichia vulneris]|uniref:dihydrodipicolinate synthase family protein n=1 Tax=Pseudescherichia vulneris TaxID=566 RepID=UPI00227B1448|nr:dihydrodipicolinate synthase family protein [Pseudescherichia vulneris]WAH52779.1 dihydrodipicolinate synthase family protein [Pseudescherichia vulneris]
MFRGLSAFPLTPITASGFDEEGFCRLLQRITAAEADSIGVLGSTGSYAYLTREQRKQIATLAVEQSNNIPVMVCVGAMATEQVLHLIDDAQTAGASALLLPVLSYQRLREDEAFVLFETVTRHTSLPVCVYDNPGTTHFTFSDTLYTRIAALSGVGSIKIPGLPEKAEDAAARVKEIRAQLPAEITLGISGDAFAGVGLNAGCEAWYSVCGGLFPRVAKEITEASARGDRQQVTQLTERLDPLWQLFRKHGGSIRVIAAAAGVLGLTRGDCLPRPLLPLDADATAEIATIINALELE